MTIDEIIAVLQAYKEGKKIEVKCKIDGTWIESPVHLWNFVDNDYRVKPEPHYRPFESAEEVMEAIKEHGDWLHGTNTDCIGFFKLLAVTARGIDTTACEPTFHFAYDMFTFADGTPFGKLVEE